MMNNEIINNNKILEILSKTFNPDRARLKEILHKAKAKKGLSLEETACLININDKELENEMFEIAARIKDEIYGERLVFFAPLYVSDHCVNDCEYCNFHIRNKTILRAKLSSEKIQEQVEFLINAGHKRVLLEFGEDPLNNPIDYIIDTINKIYSVQTEKGNIRRINVNIAATTKENYFRLKQAKIGTYQLFQETYHFPTYKKLHIGPKADYLRQLYAHNNAFESGLDDLGLGVLFGLYDWRFEVLAIMSHAEYMNKKYGIGPHTISVPRFQTGQTIKYEPEYKVSDENFLKLIAILRISVPYTGIIISTRENSEIRSTAFKIGVSQASAGSVASPGGYGKKSSQPQFEIHDKRSLRQIIETVLDDKLLPSFCTACYRLGRTGEAFMAISKHGDIHNFCRPNGILTFAEYLEDFADDKLDDKLYKKGSEVITFYLNKIENESMRNKTKERLARIKHGERDLYF
ncbi:[FeFe] hydrogenase H-cluster radical SAM maturase HydG [Candidatus Desantisbacteria bacterium]|nr:[FeFe] hydrogenase H-cluster radical SAM maturase HydG [Candidatus Desantisbacteria bacterium]